MKTILILSAAFLVSAGAYAVDTMDAPPPTTVGVRLLTARKAIDAKDWDRAIRELEAAEKTDPRNADVQNLLGYSWRKRAQPDLVKSIAYYESALRIDPKHKYAHEYIGEAYLMKRQPAEAEKHLVQLEAICGKGCEEYQDLAKSLADYKARNPS